MYLENTRTFMDKYQRNNDGLTETEREWGWDLARVEQVRQSLYDRVGLGPFGLEPPRAALRGVRVGALRAGARLGYPRVALRGGAFYQAEGARAWERGLAFMPAGDLATLLSSIERMEAGELAAARDPKELRPTNAELARYGRIAAGQIPMFI